jgi:branched-chain amino acid transport system permease protein
LHGLRRSRLGRAIVAVRDNERTAQAFGVRALGAKLSAFAVSGAVAGLAGGLFVLHQHRLNADQYAPLRSLEAFTMAAIGGLGSIPGAIAGALYVRGAQDLLESPYSVFASGLGLIFVLLVVPHGFGSIVFGIRDTVVRRVARRHRIDLDDAADVAAFHAPPPLDDAPTPVTTGVPG